MSRSTSSAKKTRRGSAKSTDPLPVRVIALDEIDPTPLNREGRNIDDLLASVQQHRVQQPIKLRPQDGGSARRGPRKPRGCAVP